MIHEEDPAEGEEVAAPVEEVGGFEDVYGVAQPVGEYRLSSRPGVVSGGA